MEGRDDRTTTTNMHKPVQETGDSTTDSSTIVGTFGNVNGKLLEDCSGLAGNSQTVMQLYASNAESEQKAMHETSLLYTEPCQEVGYNKPSALVTGAAAVEPEVKMVSDLLTPAFIVAVLLKSEYMDKPSPG